MILPAWLTTYLANAASDKFWKVRMRLSWASRLSSNPIERGRNSADLYSFFVPFVSAFSSMSYQYVRLVLSLSLRASLSRMHRATMPTIRNMVCTACISRCVIEANTTQQYFFPDENTARERVRLVSGWYWLRALYKLREANDEADDWFSRLAR